MVLTQCHFAPPDFCIARSTAYILILLPLSQVIMPRGHKRKGHSHAKCQNVREKSQSLHDAQPAAAKEEETSSIGRGDPPSSPDTYIPQDTQEDVASVADDLSLLSIGAVGGEASDTNAKFSVIDAERPSSTSIIASVIGSARRDLNRQANVLMVFMLKKFNVKEPFTQKDMLKMINKKYKEKLTDIIKRVSVWLELAFGLELKEVDPSSQSYMLVGKLGLSTEGSLSSNSGFPKTGLLMTLLALIFMNGNRASEEELWDLLKVLEMYPGQNHPIIGDPEKFIKKDLVEENYLKYCQVPNTDPPTYEFLWGPRAYTETTKMKVLEVFAKINDDVPSSYPSLYERALSDEVDRAARRVTAVPGSDNMFLASQGVISFSTVREREEVRGVPSQAAHSAGPGNKPQSAGSRLPFPPTAPCFPKVPGRSPGPSPQQARRPLVARGGPSQNTPTLSSL
ncbi:melanoma-associated antigen B17-like [Onychomys torridus]|uniref:melanoma-associated antigen B17-like n=1 Tax=Onychomys torridus TaxID=38674 RepID=UPI00167F23E2|nr:melanoma-associated antigen B17-like [Onychomys torridus]